MAAFIFTHIIKNKTYIFKSYIFKRKIISLIIQG